MKYPDSLVGSLGAVLWPFGAYRRKYSRRDGSYIDPDAYRVVESASDGPTRQGPYPVSTAWIG